MGSRKSAAPPAQTQVSLDAGKITAETAAQVEKRVAEEAAGKLKAERDKAIQGVESAQDIATREASTLANPKKQKVRGRRSLVSGSLGSGVNASRETLG